MKKIDVALDSVKLGLSGVANMAAALRAVGVDPDEEMPEAARWWEIGETLPNEWMHSDQGEIYRFRANTKAVSNRWHGPHPTAAAAREHYEASQKPRLHQAGDTIPRGWHYSISPSVEAYRDPVEYFDGAHCTVFDHFGPYASKEEAEAARKAALAPLDAPAPQTTAEDWDSDWAEKFYWDTFKACNDYPRSRARLAAEAARRALEKDASFRDAVARDLEDISTDRDRLAGEIDKLAAWFTHQGHCDLIGEGSAVDNALRLLSQYAPAPAPAVEEWRGPEFDWVEEECKLDSAHCRVMAWKGARRERETWAEERAGLMTTIQSLKDELNDKNPSTQKLASAYDEAMGKIVDLEARIERQAQVIVACGTKALACPPESGYSPAIENNYIVQCVSTLRADRDRLAAELERTKQALTALLIGIKRWAAEEDGVPDFLNDAYIEGHSVLNRAVVAHIPKPAPTPAVDYAGIVEEAKRITLFMEEDGTYDAELIDQQRLIQRLAEALAAGGGK